MLLNGARGLSEPQASCPECRFAFKHFFSPLEVPGFWNGARNIPLHSQNTILQILRSIPDTLPKPLSELNSDLISRLHPRDGRCTPSDLPPEGFPLPVLYTYCHSLPDCRGMIRSLPARMHPEAVQAGSSRVVVQSVMITPLNPHSSLAAFVQRS